MPKTPKPDQGETKETWADDQKERGYYYDDAHGYEKYEPVTDEKDAEKESHGDVESKRKPR
ncbi:MAG: hypothetical protein ABJB34_01745 [Acidobacteriota bacterium]